MEAREIIALHCSHVALSVLSTDSPTRCAASFVVDAIVSFLIWQSGIRNSFAVPRPSPRVPRCQTTHCTPVLFGSFHRPSRLQTPSHVHAWIDGRCFAAGSRTNCRAFGPAYRPSTRPPRGSDQSFPK